MRRTKCIFCLALAVFSSGCASRLSHSRQSTPSVPLDIQKRFLDLQPGWRIAVFTPVLKSGGYLPQLNLEEQQGNTIVLSAGDDMVGYGTSRYTIEKKQDGRIRIKFASATIAKQGKTASQSHPLLPLFDLPEDARYVRLIYMVRVSDSDHDTAIAAAKDPIALDQLTEAIESGLGEKCRAQEDVSCVWVPKGIGIQVEQH
jgi:hypothetical protein